MRLFSPAFQDGKFIPTKYAYTGIAGGKNYSMPLSWMDVPGDAKSFAISVIDPHPVARNWIHWLLINIPSDVFSLKENTSRTRIPEGSKELYNSFGEIGYGGPQPPKGSGQHPYVVTLYALNVESLDLTANTSLIAFEKIIEGKVIATAKTTGMFER